MSVDWPALIRLGLTLGIAPPVLWQLAVREWRALVAPAGPALTREGLAALASLYPDRPVSPDQEAPHG
jgi:uncharacterized phage protein (TIGR02216 family)